MDESIWREIRRNREEAEQNHQELKELLLPLVSEVARVSEWARTTEEQRKGDSAKVGALTQALPAHEERLKVLETRRTTINRWVFTALGAVAVGLAAWVAKIAWMVQASRIAG